MGQAGRRFLTAALVLVAVLMVAVAVTVSALHAHVRIRPLGDPWLAILVAAGLLAVAARLAVRSQPGRRTAYAVTTATAAVAAMAVGAEVLASHLMADEATRQQIVASTPTLELVSYRQSVWSGSDELVLRVRDRTGPQPQEGRDIACFLAQPRGTDVEPAWRFGHARFTGPDQLEVSAADGKTWTLTIDIRSLGVAEFLNLCAAAAD